MNAEHRLMQLGDLEFLEGAYALMLGRMPDAGGLRHFMDLLQSGTSRERVLEDLQGSEEGRVHAARQQGPQAQDTAAKSVNVLLGIRDDVEFVERSHEALTGQAVSEDTSALWLQHIARTGRRLDVLQHLRRSPAGRAHRCNLSDVHTLELTPEQLTGSCHASDMLAVSNESFLHLAYRCVLGRDVDDVGRSDLLHSLEQGMARSAALRQLQDSAEGRAHGAQVEGLADALESLEKSTRTVGEPMTGQNLPVADMLAGGADPIAVDTANGSRESPLVAITARLAERLAGDFSGEAGQNANRGVSHPPPNTRASPPRTSVVSSLLESVSAAEPLGLNGFVGAFAHGWSFGKRSASPCVLHFGGRAIGSLRLDQARRDLQAAHGLASDKLGFAALLGGLLHFSALAQCCESIRLEQPDNPGVHQDFPLRPFLAEGLAFSPLKSFTRLRDGLGAGHLLSLSLGPSKEFSLMFETADRSAAASQAVFLDVYQEEAPGSLARLSRFSVELTGQMTMLETVLLTSHAPVLLVMTDAKRHIVLTECVPLPEIHAAKQRALVDYHSVLANGQDAFNVEAKISRAYLDDAIRLRLGPAAETHRPRRQTTKVLVYSRDHFDFTGDAELDAMRGAADDVAILTADGQAQLRGGAITSLRDYLLDNDARHVLIVEFRCSLRPDFWAMLQQHLHRLDDGVRLVRWQSLWLEGMARPYLAKPGLLLHAAFSAHRLVPMHAALVHLDEVLNVLDTDSSMFRSGSLRLEHAFANLPGDAVATVPLALDTVVWPAAPRLAARLAAEHLPVPDLPPPLTPAAPLPSLCVIVNFRNSVDATIACLESVRKQVYGGALEVVLVNNLSSPDVTAAVANRARALFGTAAIKLIDYPFQFNHSAQCNLAAKATQSELLMMLSNDSLLLSDNLLSLAAGVAQVPWVATVGFRIVGTPLGKRRLQSLGLGAAQRQFLFQGGSPLSTYQPPHFLHDHTLETLGNTFAAVVLRRDVYFALGGLDEDAFPTNYNDVDFCCRALQRGLRHVSIGAAVVDHVGRGSRESDLDLPIDQRIIERCPDLAVLARIGVHQL